MGPGHHPREEGQAAPWTAAAALTVSPVPNTIIVFLVHGQASVSAPVGSSSSATAAAAALSRRRRRSGPKMAAQPCRSTPSPRQESRPSPSAAAPAGAPAVPACLPGEGCWSPGSSTRALSGPRPLAEA